MATWSWRCCKFLKPPFSFLFPCSYTHSTFKVLCDPQILRVPEYTKHTYWVYHIILQVRPLFPGLASYGALPYHPHMKNDAKNFKTRKKKKFFSRARSANDVALFVHVTRN